MAGYYIHAEDRGAIDRLVVYTAAALANSYEADRRGTASREYCDSQRKHALDLAYLLAATANAETVGLADFLNWVPVNPDLPVSSFRSALHQWIGGFFEDTDDCQCGGDHGAAPAFGGVEA